MIFYYIRYSETWSDETITFSEKKEQYFSTKKEAELFWKKEIRDAKAHNKFPKPHQIDTPKIIGVGIFSETTDYAEISKDKIIYNAPKQSNFLVIDDKNWVWYYLTIEKPQKLVLGKNKKDIAYKLSSISTSYYES